MNDAAWWTDECDLLRWMQRRQRIAFFLFADEPYWLGCAGEVAARALAGGTARVDVYDWTRATSYQGLSSRLRSPVLRRVEAYLGRHGSTGGSRALTRALLEIGSSRVETRSTKSLSRRSGDEVDQMLLARLNKPLRSVQYKGTPAGWAAFGSLAHLFSSSRADELADAQESEAMLRSFAEVFDATRDRLSEHRPDVVLLFNGRLLHEWAVREAAWSLGLDVVVAEAGRTSEHFTLHWNTAHGREQYAGRLLRIASEAPGLNDPERRLLAERWFRNRRPGSGVAANEFVQRQAAGVAPPRPVDKRRISFFTSSSDELTAAGPQWSSALGSQEEILDALVAKVSRNPQIELVIRMHPHTLLKHVRDQAWWAHFASRLEPGVVVLPPDSPVDSYSLLEQSDLVLSLGSTIGIEAAYWGTPSVTLGPALYESLSAVDAVASLDEALAITWSENERLTRRERSLAWGLHEATLGQPYDYFRPETSGQRFGDQHLARWGTWERFLPGGLMHRRRDKQRAQATGVKGASRVLGAQ